MPDAISESQPCEVKVIRVVEAAVYRGPGVDSPARNKTLENLPPGTRERWAGRDHGVEHLACTYEVTVADKPFRHRHTAEQSFTGAELDTAKCSADETKRAVEKSIREFTKGCTDLAAGEYWGHRLEPLEPIPPD